MKRRIIEITAAIVVFLGIVLVVSCAANESRDTIRDEKETNNTVETTITESISGEGERRATSEEIDEMHQNLEQILLDNYDVFNQIVGYFENTQEDYSCGLKDGEIVVRFRDVINNGPFVYIDLYEIELAEQIAFVIKEFGFVSIHEDDRAVWFTMVYHGKYPDVGHYDQGLVCNKSNAGFDGIKEKRGPSDRENIRIKDEWFRYHAAYYEDLITG